MYKSNRDGTNIDNMWNLNAPSDPSFVSLYHANIILQLNMASPGHLYIFTTFIK